ncbi:MAG: sensor histidine kinase [Myxococcales bacterium]|nr:sensor histidine kinase [Myxococcales bacterium]
MPPESPTTATGLQSGHGQSLLSSDAVAAELHHRINNNLQVVASLLSLHLGLLPPEHRPTLERYRERVRAIALICDRFGGRATLDELGLAAHIRQLCSICYQIQSDTTMDLELEVAPLRIGIDTAVPLGLILGELVDNAYRHAFTPSGRGCLTITLRPEPDGRWLLRVADDGPGLPSGLCWKQAQTLGAQICNALAGQLDGQLQGASDSTGAVFELRFSLGEPAVGLEEPRPPADYSDFR